MMRSSSTEGGGLVKEQAKADAPSEVSRREFLKGMGTGVAATGLLSAGISPVESEAASGKRLGPGAVRISLRVNSAAHQVAVEPRHTLLEALRDRLGITGPKPICERGSCGGCTVLMDGQPVYSCMMLAVDGAGKEITTVEGLADGDRLDPVQEAFIRHDALMCGFCTPGFVMSVKALLDRNPNPALEDVKAAVSGNLCRCGTYPRVFEAALAAAKMQRGEG
jgi:aerobic-type carbon monoxide dehydrogenase small subunit (CoxS/CutS family)